MPTNKTLQLVLKFKDEASKGFSKFSSSLEKNKEGLKKMGLVGGVATAGLLLATKKLINASFAQERAESRLFQLTKNSTKATKEQVQVLLDQARALQKIGVVGDEITIVGQSQLATFALTTDQISKLTPSLLDMIVAQKGVNATQEDAITVANAVGRALDGGAGALTRYGISLTDAQKELFKVANRSERVSLLSDILTSNFGGLNKSTKRTAEGGLKALSNSFGDLQEVLGDAFIPALREIVEKIKPAIDSMTQWAQKNKSLISILGGSAIAVSSLLTIIGSFGLTAFVLKTSIVQLIPIVKGLRTAFKFMLGPLGLTIVALTTIATFLSQTLNKDFLASADSSRRLGDAADKMREKLIKARNPIKKISDAITNLGKNTKETAAKIKTLEQEISKTIKNNSDKQAKFKENLAQTIVNQEQNVADLTKQIKEKEAEASTTTIKSSAHEELSVLKSKLAEEVSALESVKQQKFGIQSELTEMRRRAELTDFELRVENLLRQKVEDLKAFKEKLQTQLTELKALKGVRDAQLNIEKKYTDSVVAENNKRAKSYESMAARAKIAMNSIITSSFSNLGIGGQTTPATSGFPSLQSAGHTVNINGGTYLSEDAAEKIGDKIMDKLKTNIRM